MSQDNLSQVATQQLRSAFQEAMWPAGVVALVLSPVTVLANGLVLATIFIDPFKNIRNSPSSYLIFSLALADFFVGTLVEPLEGFWNISVACNKTPPFSSTIIWFSAQISVGVSHFSLVALSVDRRIAITTPLQYAYRVTKKKIRIAIVCIWCYFFFIGILFIIFQSYDSNVYIMFSAHWVIASFILVILNIATIRSVHIQGQNIKKNLGSENSIVLQNAFNREKTVTQTIVIMVVAFEICLWPTYILSLIVNIVFRAKTTNLHDYKPLIWFYSLSKTLLLANSLMNPFLYAWRLPKYRKAFKYILSQLKKKLSITQVQMETNSSAELPVLTYNSVAHDSLNLPSLEKHDNVKTWSQETVSHSNANEAGVHDCSNNEEHSMGDTRL